jgi:hypothetical protein
MGRMLDTLYAAGVTEVFLEVAREARQAFPIPVRALHADATSFADTGGIPLLFAPGDGNQKEAQVREVDVEEEGLRRRVARAEGEAEKALGRLLSRRLACEADARRALAVDEKASGKLPYHRLVYLGVQEERRRGRVGRPRKGEAPLSVGYRLLARLEVDEGKLERARRGLGRFLLATDVLDREALLAGEVLGRTVERGFRFLKDPLFFTGSTFLKRPERVMALALLVYALVKDPPCAGCSGSSSGCAWRSWRAGPWSSTWPPITRPRCACWGRGDITSWRERGAECERGVRNVGQLENPPFCT